MSKRERRDRSPIERSMVAIALLPLALLLIDAATPPSLGIPIAGLPEPSPYDLGTTYYRRCMGVNSRADGEGPAAHAEVLYPQPTGTRPERGRVSELGEVSQDEAGVPPVITRPPPPAPPRSAAARRSCPLHDTSRWPSKAPYGPAPADPSRHTACPDPGGSGRRAGACRVLRPA